MKSWLGEVLSQVIAALVPLAVAGVVLYFAWKKLFGGKNPSQVFSDTLSGAAAIPSGLVSLIDDKLNGYSESNYITTDQQTTQAAKALAAKNAAIAAGATEEQALQAMRAAIGAS